MTTTTLLGYDLETLGMAPPLAVIELGWCSLEIGEDGPAHLGSMSGSELFGIPEGQVMSPDNQAVHHISPQMLEGRPLFDVREWGGAALNDATHAFAHNAEFEQQWLADLDPDLRWICTYKVALRLLPDAPSHSNQCLKYVLGIADVPAHHPPHRALPDTIVTALVLEQLIRRAQQTFRDRGEDASLERVLARFVEITGEPRLLPRCPIGQQWKGRPWREVDSGFLSWMLRQPDMEADLKWNAERELTRRRRGD
jgi:exodeoxyribonuclease X